MIRAIYAGLCWLADAINGKFDDEEEAMSQMSLAELRAYSRRNVDVAPDSPPR